MTNVELATAPPVAVKRRDHPAAGYLFALTGALLFGINGSVTKVVMTEGLTAEQVTLFRTLVTAGIAGAWLAWRHRAALRVTRRQVIAMAILGVGGVAMIQWLYAEAIALLPVGIALLIQYTAVLLVALASWLFFKERVHRRLWLAIALVLAGLAVVAQVWDSELNALGVAAAAGAAVAYALYFLMGEHGVARQSPMVVTFWSMLFAAVFWAVFSQWWRIDVTSFAEPVSMTGALTGLVVPLWLPVLWIVTLGAFVPFLFLFLALARLRATAVGILASTEVLFAFAVAWVWLGEALTFVQCVGAVVVLIGIVVAQTARYKPRTALATRK
ncbi:MAG: EamA family transporter [Actinobacteria bacterium HGW-Actinobacteria-4]|nr:MAG: EamA family transporter [Actinobacteria bacterium HGW-Actinobacteria-4]